MLHEIAAPGRLLFLGLGGWGEYAVEAEVAGHLGVVVFEVAGDFDEGAGTGDFGSAEEGDGVTELGVLEGGKGLIAGIKGCFEGSDEGVLGVGFGDFGRGGGGSGEHGAEA